jgi:hypothetical protein
MTFMPASAKAWPSASPMPLAPPVTNAVLPARSRMMSLRDVGAPAEITGKDRSAGERIDA